MNNSNKKLDITPKKIYKNAALLRKQILTDNKGLSGVYRWLNNITGKTYIGSGKNLGNRIAYYYSPSTLKKDNRPITRALLKYGHENFTLEILEFCSASNLIEREQFYFDNFLNPEDYNVLKFAYSTLGRIASRETRDKLSIAIKNYRKNKPARFVSDMDRLRMEVISILKLKIKATNLTNMKIKAIARQGVAVTVLNTQTNEEKKFTNQTEAGLFVGISKPGVYNAIKRASLVKGIYLITKRVAD